MSTAHQNPDGSPRRSIGEGTGLGNDPSVEERGRLAALILFSVSTMILLTWVPGHRWDLWIYGRWAQGLLQNGFNDPGLSFSMPYPPAFNLWLWVVAHCYAALSLQFYADQLMKLTVLVPVFAAHALFLVLLWRIQRARESHARSRLVLLVSAFNPVVLFIGPIWGQVDFCALTLVVAAIALLLRGRTGIVWGPAVFVLAVMSKQHALVFAPLLAALYVRQARAADRRDLAIGVATAAVALLALWTPYLWVGGARAAFARCFLQLDASAYRVAVYNAYNLWCLLTGEIPDNLSLLAGAGDGAAVGGWLTPKHLGTAAFALVVLFAASQALYRKHETDIWGWATFTALSFFILPTGVHERYLVLAIPVAAAWAAADPRKTAWYLALSFLGFLNAAFEYPHLDYHFRHAASWIAVLAFLMLLASLSGSALADVWARVCRWVGRAPWAVGAVLVVFWGFALMPSVHAQRQAQAAEQARHDGAHRVYLSELRPIACDPPCDPERFDRTADLRAISLRGVMYPRGLSVEGPSNLLFPIPMGAKTFYAAAGIDDAVSGESRLPWRRVSVSPPSRKAVFRVLVDDVPVWSSTVVTATSATETCRIDIGAGRTLRLVIEPQEGSGAYYDWAGAVLLGP